MKNTLIAVTGALCLLLATAGHATVILWTSTIDQAQEVGAPVPVPGAMGSATGTIDTDTNELSWFIEWSGLSGLPFAMHFHMAPRGLNGGVEVNIGAISGLGSPSIGSTFISDPQMTDLLAGNWYINIHTPLNPGGEIRGQVDIARTVPEPATLSLLLAGLLGMRFARRS